ncbi:MAG: hypothetical protein AB1489_30470, partial [Acidobacteriota bacterium]
REGGDSEISTYSHLILNFLEYWAVQDLLGELKARQVIEFWTTDHYTWIYKIVLEQNRDIAKVVFKYKLIPPSRT